MNLIDQLISVISPEAGFRRAGFRQALYENKRYAAANISRSRGDWFASKAGENATLAKTIPETRARATQQVRDNPLALRMVDLWVLHIIGDGMKTRFMPQGGVSTRTARKQNEVFNAWGESTYCDAEGLNNIYGLHANACWILVEKGEVFLRKMVMPSNHPLAKTTPLRLQIKVLEPEFLDHGKNGTNIDNGNPISMGIEFDKNFPDVRVAYWMFPEHPGENPKVSLNLRSVRVPAGEIAHVFMKTRNNIRGVTWLHAALETLKDLDDYLAALKMKAKIEACFTILIQQTANSQSAPIAGRSQRQEEDVEEIAPGLVRRLKPGEDAKAFDPGNSSGHSALLQTFIRMAAIAAGLTYDQAYSDLTGANYSSLRAGKMEFNRSVSRRQWVFEQMAVQPICQWFAEIGHVSGLWSSPNFVANVSPAPSDFVDPKKDGDAEKQEVEMGFATWSKKVADRGTDPETHTAELEAEFKLFEKMGVEHPFKKAMSMVGTKPAATATVAKPDDEDEKEAA